ncbi:MAG: hypothetical protein IID41_16675 [Planctomycetes bacterium]|nr:hypothetical protein [Planctomycetota bacterium]
MPRPTKAIRRKRLDAVIAYKRGERKEAYKLWETAAAALKEHHAKKHNKKKPAEDGEATATATATEE